MDDIQRIDYSKPPPGYSAHVLAGASGVNSRGESRVVPSQHATMPPVTPLKCGRDFDWYSTQDASTAAAWAYHKAHNYPPGLRVSYVLTVGWIVMVEEPKRLHIHTEVSAASARTAAWAWHDRRLTLAAKLDVALIVDDEPFKGQTIRTVVPAGEARHFDGEQRPYAAWPCILTWSDEQVSSAERWLLDSTAEMPEVLRG